MGFKCPRVCNNALGLSVFGLWVWAVFCIRAVGSFKVCYFRLLACSGFRGFRVSYLNPSTINPKATSASQDFWMHPSSLI